MKGILKKLFGPVVRWNLAAMVLVSIALFAGLWIWMTRYTMHGEGVDVPEFAGVAGFAEIGLPVQDDAIIAGGGFQDFRVTVRGVRYSRLNCVKS